MTGDIRDARKVTCPTCGAEPGKGCRAENGYAISGWHPERRRVAKGEPRTEMGDLIARSSLGTREVQDIAAQTPDHVVEEILRRVRIGRKQDR